MNLIEYNIMRIMLKQTCGGVCAGICGGVGGQAWYLADRRYKFGVKM